MDKSYELKKPILCIVGPTSSGKSELAQRVAEKIGGEVVSADSMQIYEGMDIGTGKLLEEERRVPHFGLDITTLDKAYSAQMFQDYARKCFLDIERRERVAILCGGTGFYVRCAIDDYNMPKGEQTQNPIREQYLEMLDTLGAQAVWDELDKLDPESAAIIHPNNSKRVIRALEMHDAGTSYADMSKKLSSIPQALPAVFVGLQIDRQVLYERINSRVDKMLEQGLIDEVKALLDRGFADALTSKQAIGYKEIIEYFDGDCSLGEAVEKIKRQTRRYAKRQISWFKADSRINWLDATNLDYDDLTSKTIDLYLNATQ